MTHIQQRRDTFANWTLVNPVLMEGEAGHETNTGRWKLGDGFTPYIDLPYKSGVDSVAGKTGAVNLEVADVAGAAPLDSPTFTGAPKVPSPAGNDVSQRVPNTLWVMTRGFAPLASPNLTGDPTAPTAAAGDKDISIANTQWVDNEMISRARPTVANGAGSTLDYDTMTNAGWYVMSEEAPNAPTIAGPCYLDVRSYGNNAKQVATLVSTGATYYRYRFAGAWGQWNVDRAGINYLSGIVLSSGISPSGEGVYAYRKNGVVTLSVYITTSTGTNPILTMPAGWRPIGALRGELSPTISTSRSVLLSTAGVLSSEGGVPAILFGSLTYVCDQL